MGVQNYNVDIYPEFETLDAELQVVVAMGVQGEQGVQGPKGDKGDAGTNGVGIFNIVNNGDGTMTIYLSDGRSYVTQNLKGDKGDKGDTGSAGPQGVQGEQGVGISSVTLNSDFTLTIEFDDESTYTTPVSIRGEKGEKGEQGEQGEIGYTGNGIAGIEMSQNTGILEITLDDGTKFVSPISLIGPQGPQGIQGIQGIQGVKGDTGATGATGATGPRGEKGLTGDAGRGIVSITKTATVGKVDTYTITYSDNTTSTYTVTNGQDGSSGNDVYVQDLSPQETGDTPRTGDIWISNFTLKYRSFEFNETLTPPDLSSGFSISFMETGDDGFVFSGVEFTGMSVQTMHDIEALCFEREGRDVPVYAFTGSSQGWDPEIDNFVIQFESNDPLDWKLHDFIQKNTTPYSGGGGQDSI